MERLAARLEKRQARRSFGSLAPHKSAVAIVLVQTVDDLSVLLMKRADRRGDRWSGHISFPGGRRQPEDTDLRQTAIRETREEVGLDLATTRCLGHLDDLTASVHGGISPMTIRPFVFVEPSERNLTLGPEAKAAFRVPLAILASGELNSVHWFRWGPIPIPLPCWVYEGHIIWGLTHRMIGQLLRAFEE